MKFDLGVWIIISPTSKRGGATRWAHVPRIFISGVSLASPHELCRICRTKIRAIEALPSDGVLKTRRTLELHERF